MNELAQKLAQYLKRDDPEIDYRIENGIETNRKGFGEISLVDAAGKPVPSADITLKHMRHEFQFGCNAFMLEQFPSAEQNARYEELFRDLFNLAVVPLYWSDLEPKDGHLRFAKTTEPIYRRPQPDLCLEFCEKNRITPKGHPLLWHLFRPEWLSDDNAVMERRIRQRFREIADRYAGRIKIWDVCNEAQTMAIGTRQHVMPENHVELAFTLAAQYFPDCVRTYNDDRMWYHFSKSYSPVYLLVKSLLDRGYAVNALGLQYHMFEGQLQYASQFMNPVYLFRILDQYAKLGLPINFSEVSIISRRDLGDGDEFQRFVTEKLYRLWFSHPAVNGATWWNLVDGTAAFAPLGSEHGENSLRAGLVNFDMTPKPAYLAIQNLIKKQWRTDTGLAYQQGAVNKFRGFFGEYEVKIKAGAQTFTRSLQLSKGNLNLFRFVLNE
ncbi:MAG: endo-1,4-beta-xylanase [Spirochaetes bacterium]|nr:endo-1,4-beta-xylanase [Spirochaetota bacterium]